VGVLKAKRAPTPQHPYGYMRDRFVWSLISAVCVLLSGHEEEGKRWYACLLACMVLIKLGERAVGLRQEIQLSDHAYSTLLGAYYCIHRS